MSEQRSAEPQSAISARCWSREQGWPREPVSRWPGSVQPGPSFLQQLARLSSAATSFLCELPHHCYSASKPDLLKNLIGRLEL